MSSALPRVSRLLIVVLVAIASADLVCALPCSLPAASSAGAPEQAQHHCHEPADTTPSTTLSSTEDPCGMEHGRTRPAAERPTFRLELAPDPAIATSLVLVTTPGGSQTVHRTRGTPPGGGPPERHITLRI